MASKCVPLAYKWPELFSHMTYKGAGKCGEALGSLLTKHPSSTQHLLMFPPEDNPKPVTSLDALP